MLKLVDIEARYSQIVALRNIDIEIAEKEIVTLLGGNAAGKTTTMNTVMGIVRATKGRIIFQDEELQGLDTAKIVEKGIMIVPEGRRVFPRMSVFENLEMGAYCKTKNARFKKNGFKKNLDEIFLLFPRLKEREKQMAGTLSGGEQQMLAMARAMMGNPKLLLLDEPSMGLAPVLVEQVFEIIKGINQRGTTIFLVEQNARMALSIADRGYVLQTGQIVMSDTGVNLLENEEIRKAYFG